MTNTIGTTITIAIIFFDHIERGGTTNILLGGG